MKPLKLIKKPSVGFYLLAIALALTIAAFIVYFLTFDAFHYELDRWVIALVVISLWCTLCLMGVSLFVGIPPIAVDIFYIAAAFTLTIAAIKFFIPCLSPIGIYFTVHNMGDVEANAIGVPRSLAGIAMFVLAVVALIASAFFNVTGAGESKRAKESVASGDLEELFADVDFNDVDDGEVQ